MALKIRYWKRLERHPRSADHGDMDGPKFERMVEVIKEHGIADRRKITIHEGKVFNGWQLLQACVQADVKPEFQLLPKGWDPDTYDEAMNELRRFETPEAIAARAAQRRERVAAAYTDGQSTREIAKAEGVSQTQVQRDISKNDSASDSPGSENSAEHGENEGARDSRAPEPTIFCRPCRVRGVKANCPECKRLRELKAKPPEREPGDDSASEQAAANDEPITDAEGKPVPPQALIAFERAKLMTEWGREVDALVRRAKELAEGDGGRLIDYESVKVHIRNGKATVLQNRPTHVCPMCEGKPRRNGKPCDCCKGCGWTVEHVWKRLTQEKAAKA